MKDPDNLVKDGVVFIEGEKELVDNEGLDVDDVIGFRFVPFHNGRKLKACFFDGFWISS